jgi:hypothetical protein
MRYAKPAFASWATCPGGDHLCVFYETKEDLLDTAATYFATRLASNEFCVWAISDPITEKDAKTSLRREIRDFDHHLANGRIEILQATEWYLKEDQTPRERVTLAQFDDSACVPPQWALAIGTRATSFPL